MKNNIKIIFFGTPLFASIVLEKLILSKYKPFLVITETDKKANKNKLKEPEVKTTAKKNNIDIFQPDTKKEIFSFLKDKEIDIIITCAYGKIIPKNVLDLAKFGCYNIHPSLLPKYRGPSPIQYAILNGDKETGVTIFKMNEKMDEGEIIASKKIDLIGNEKSSTLFITLANLSSCLLIDIIPKIYENKINLKSQDNNIATYTKIINKEDGKINFNEGAKNIERKLRAFDNWPGIFTFWKKNDKELLRIKIISVEILKENNNFKIGEIFKTKEKEMAIRCKEDNLILKEIQIESKKITSGKDFLIGNKGIVGSILG